MKQLEENNELNEKERVWKKRINQLEAELNVMMEERNG